VAVAKLRHPGDPLLIRGGIVDLVSPLIALDKSCVRVSDQACVEAAGSCVPSTHKGIPVGPTVSIHSEHTAISFYEQSAVVVELPVVSQRPVEGDPTAILAFEPPVKASAWYLKIDCVEEKFPAVKKDCRSASILNNADIRPGLLTLGARVLASNADSLVVRRLTAAATRRFGGVFNLEVETERTIKKSCDCGRWRCLVAHQRAGTAFLLIATRAVY
jgi:hypothetical protein